MKNESGLSPTADKILVLPIKVEEKTQGGIVLPKMAQEKEQFAQRVGTLLAVGPDAEGAPELSGVEIGDQILFARYSGDFFPVDGVDYIIMRVSDVVGKVTKLPDYMLQARKSSPEVFGLNQKVA